MKRFLSEHNSQSENDHFILECIFFLIIIVTICVCIRNRKKLYAKFVDIITNAFFENFRLLTGLLILIVISSMFVYKFIKQILF
ncbi:Uncharacterised protein [Flavobacterium hibernum]|nr:Uncharacterised protein [Flavobacterium hibernum]